MSYLNKPVMIAYVHGIYCNKLHTCCESEGACTCCVRICRLHVQWGEMRQTISMQRLAKMRTHVPIVQWDQYYLGYPVKVTCWSLLDGIRDVSNQTFRLSYIHIHIVWKEGYTRSLYIECFNCTGPWDTLEQNDAMRSSGTPKKNIGEPSRASTNLQMS